ncbi:trx1 [Symbiodinium natans]|uniref:Trx1 protein n=1 Tax=Symbiodinium natans TaxID=878477 RepID=A0A812U315_9DINO|nr:trx1 [Symbiodinium natans]
MSSTQQHLLAEDTAGALRGIQQRTAAPTGIFLRIKLSQRLKRRSRCDFGIQRGGFLMIACSEDWRQVLKSWDVTPKHGVPVSRHHGYLGHLGLEKQTLAAALAAGCVWRRCKRIARKESEGEGRGIIRSVIELPKQTALGIEIRASSVVAAPISATDGTFKKPPLRAEYCLDPLDAHGNQQAVADSIRQLVAHFKWQGAVGCSINKTVCELLGMDATAISAMEMGAGKLLSEALVGKASSVHATVHATIAGYNHLVWDESSANEEKKESWMQEVVLVATLGRNISTVVFNHGKRVRRTEWCQCARPDSDNADSPEVNGCPPQVLELSNALPFHAPSLESPEWGQWAETVDENLSQLLASVTIDRLVIVPTGRTAEDDAALLENLKPRLTNTFQRAVEKGCKVSLVAQGEGSMVRGAATSALIELQADQMLKELREVLSHGSSLQSVSDNQLRIIFDRLDLNGDGLLEVEDLQQGLEMLGVQRDVQELLKELNITKGPVMLEEFMPWWHKNVRNARIVTLSSSQAWQRLLQMPPPEGFGDLILLQVTFTFCRACKGFEPKLRKLAEEYSDVRFVQLVGNASIGAMNFVQQLKCQGSPSFFLFRRGSGELLAKWHGANADKVRQHLSPYVENGEGENENAGFGNFGNFFQF